jgi:hypothetical protein
MAPPFPPCTDYVILCAVSEDGTIIPLRCTADGELLTKIVPDPGA